MTGSMTNSRPSIRARRCRCAFSLPLVATALGCPDSPDKAREETTIEWEQSMYEARKGEQLTAVLVLSSPFGVGDYATYVESSDVSVVEVLTGRPVDSSPGEDNYQERQVANVDGPQDIQLRCAGTGTATITARHVGSDGHSGVGITVDDQTTVVCSAAVGSSTGDTGGTSGGTMTDPTDDTTAGESTGSMDSSSEGSTGGSGSACASGRATAPSSTDVIISGVDLVGEITGDAADCPMLLCTFTVTNNRDAYVTVGLLESVPEDPIFPTPVVSAIAPGDSTEFEVWIYDCTTPIALDRTLFVHDEAESINLGEVDLLWETVLP